MSTVVIMPGQMKKRRTVSEYLQPPARVLSTVVRPFFSYNVICETKLVAFKLSKLQSVCKKLTYIYRAVVSIEKIVRQSQKRWIAAAESCSQGTSSIQQVVGTNS